MSQKVRKVRVGRRAAIAGVALLAIATPVAANVAITNFMDAEFQAAAPPCLLKVAGEDVTSFPDGFGFTDATTTTVDGVSLTQEHVTIKGVVGDRVLADEVWRIENNCTTSLDVSITAATSSGTWTERHLEVWLGNTTNVGAYPSASPAPAATQWDQTPIEITAAGVTNAATGTVTVPSGQSVPVGMVVSTGASATGQGDATWQVSATTP